MLHIGKDIHSLTDFKRRTSELVAQLQETKRPVVLTVNGRSAVVVQDAEAYQELVDNAELWKEHQRQATTRNQGVSRGADVRD
jgi:prevent-host-death family protein